MPSSHSLLLHPDYTAYTSASFDRTSTKVRERKKEITYISAPRSTHARRFSLSPRLPLLNLPVATITATSCSRNCGATEDFVIKKIFVPPMFYGVRVSSLSSSSFPLAPPPISLSFSSPILCREGANTLRVMKLYIGYDRS